MIFIKIKNKTKQNKKRKKKHRVKKEIIHGRHKIVNDINNRSLDTPKAIVLYWLHGYVAEWFRTMDRVHAIVQEISQQLDFYPTERRAKISGTKQIPNTVRLIFRRL